MGKYRTVIVVDVGGAIGVVTDLPHSEMRTPSCDLLDPLRSAVSRWLHTSRAVTHLLLLVAILTAAVFRLGLSVRTSAAVMSPSHPRERWARVVVGSSI